MTLGRAVKVCLLLGVPLNQLPLRHIAPSSDVRLSAAIDADRIPNIRLDAGRLLNASLTARQATEAGGPPDIKASSSASSDAAGDALIQNRDVRCGRGPCGRVGRGS
jgi:hypothetical protein